MKSTSYLLLLSLALQTQFSCAMLFRARLMFAIKNYQRSLCTRPLTKSKKFSITPAKVVQKEAIWIHRSQWPKLIPILDKEHGKFLQALLNQEKKK